MDMNEPHKFWNGGHALYRARSGHGWLHSTPILVFLLTLWLLVNCWGAWVVGIGLIATENFKVFPNWSIYSFAGLIQTAVAVGLLYLPSYLRRGFGGWTTAVLVGSCIVVLNSGEVFHQIIAQVKEGQGQAMREVHETKIDNLHAQVDAAVADIRANYRELSSSFAKGARDAAAGRDETGIAVCANICLSRWKKYEIAGGYTDIMQGFQPATGTNLREKLTSLESRLLQLKARQARLVEFLKAVNDAGNASPPAHVVLAIRDIEKVLNDSSSFYARMNGITDRALAMEEAFSIPGKLMRGEAMNKQSMLAAGYGLATTLMLIVFGAAIRHISAMRSPQNLKQLRDALKQAQLQRGAWDELAEAQMQADIARIFAESSVTSRHI